MTFKLQGSGMNIINIFFIWLLHQWKWLTNVEKPLNSIERIRLVGHHTCCKNRCLSARLRLSYVKYKSFVGISLGDIDLETSSSLYSTSSIDFSFDKTNYVFVSVRQLLQALPSRPLSNGYVQQKRLLSSPSSPKKEVLQSIKRYLTKPLRNLFAHRCDG